MELHNLRLRYQKLHKSIDNSINTTNTRFKLDTYAERSSINIPTISLSCDDLSFDFTSNSNSKVNLNSNDTSLIEKYFDWYMKGCMEKNICAFHKLRNYMNHYYRKLLDPLFVTVFEKDIPNYYKNILSQLFGSLITKDELNIIIKYAQAKVCDIQEINSFFFFLLLLHLV